MMTNQQAALIAASNVVREDYVKDAAEKFLRWLDKKDAEREPRDSTAPQPTTPDTEQGV